MNLSVHILAYNEARILPFTLRHYATFASKITVHDLGSTDATRDIAAAAGARVVQHDTRGQCDDQLNRTIKNEAWKNGICTGDRKGSRETENELSASDPLLPLRSPVKSDCPNWIITADADEFITFPFDRFFGAGSTLAAYDLAGVPIVKPQGYEMFSEAFPTDDGVSQLYHHIRHGAPEPDWYCKPILFSPSRIEKLGFGVGAHAVEYRTLGATQTLRIDRASPTTDPATHLLHFHHIKPLEEIAADYDAHLARMSPLNREKKWGNHEPGLKHAQDKRRQILARLVCVLECSTTHIVS
jgi:hypothetical protein